MSQLLPRIYIACGALVLLIAIVGQIGISASSPASMVPAAPTRMVGVLGNVHGWEVRDLPLSADPFEERRTYDVLRFDEFLYKEVARGEDRFSVFVAHWKNNAAAGHAVASHTPDKCWVMRGWTCSRHARLEGKELGFDGLPRGYWREFRAPDGGRVHVVYWHFVDGILQDYGGDRLNFAPGAWYWVRSAQDGMMRGVREQYFIRVNSPKSFAEFVDRDGLREVAAELRRIASPPR